MMVRFHLWAFKNAKWRSSFICKVVFEAGGYHPSLYIVKYIVTKVNNERGLLLRLWRCFLPLPLKGTSLVFSLLSLFWWGGRAGLMRQIANLLVGLEPTRRFESSSRRFYACVAQLVRAYPS